MNNPKASILDGAAAARGWDPADDPGNICIKYPAPKAERQCHCPAKSKRNHLNGMKPMLDLEEEVIRCGHCFAPVGPGCHTREVMWLRGLLKLSQTNPEHFDAASIPDKIFRR